VRAKRICCVRTRIDKSLKVVCFLKRFNESEAYYKSESINLFGVINEKKKREKKREG
jgi:hypothetical protein